VERCEACEFSYDELTEDAIALAVRQVAEQLAERLAPSPVPDVAHDLRLRAHPISGVWSALEYACHVRDVLLVQRARIHQAQVEDRPEFTPMGREERVERDRYNEQSPATVAAELRDAARALADDLDALAPAGWQRTGVYNWPEREERTVAWIAVHTVHELVHHMRDVDDVLEAAA
jgi:hypothetical protein